jgi:hypothetical protein
VIDRPSQRLAAAHKQHLQIFIPFERFQIGLPPGKFGIILRANWHRPGGCRPIPKSENAAVSGFQHRKGKRDAKSEHQRTEYVRRGVQ